MKCWYKRIGPFSWYRWEWIQFSLTWRNWLGLIVQYNPGKYFRIDVGGTVHKRSIYGSPVEIEPKWSFARQWGGWAIK